MKGFLDIKVGDMVICLDEYSRGLSYHILKIDSIEEDAEYSTESNPLGRRYFGTDQDYLNEDGEFEDGDYEYLTVVDEGNFVCIKDENKTEISMKDAIIMCMEVDVENMPHNGFRNKTEIKEWYKRLSLDKFMKVFDEYYGVENFRIYNGGC